MAKIVKSLNFKKEVLRAVRKIPRGKVTTYKEVAKAIGRPQAYRAVGSALNKNPQMVKIPCHRVVKTNGQIGGYAEGIKKKTVYLKAEGLKIKRGKIFNFRKYFYKF